MGSEAFFLEDRVDMRSGTNRENIEEVVLCAVESEDEELNVCM